MPRVDIWDVAAAKQASAPIDCGYARNFSDKYVIQYTIGQGGFGVVRCVKDVLTGEEYAAKSICKKLDVPNLSAEKQARHIDNIKREVSILRKLRGTLSVVHFKGVYEDNEFIHMVMEYCRGGELHHAIGRRHYTEKTVVRVMRACMQTLAQCHSHHILHRDIKPGNFMFLNDEEESPVKALDFGLAVFYRPNELPRTDLGLEGTPWFMAPEVLSSQVVPASDVWAGGVMAYQLLTGYLPFDDRRHPNSPALSEIWKMILSSEPKFSGSAWAQVSEASKDFCRLLLNKDPEQRPSAKAALQHPWLRPDGVQLSDKPISATVVQRLQRYAQGNLLKRSILELIASELLELMKSATPDPSTHSGSLMATAGSNGSIPESLHAPASPGRPPAAPQPPSLPSPMQRAATTGHALNRMGGASSADLDSLDDETFKEEVGHRLRQRVNSAHGGTEYFKMREGMKEAAIPPKATTTHGAKHYFRIMRAAAALMNTGKRAHGSTHGGADYLHVAARSESERQEQAKARRLALDTSAHGGQEFNKLVSQLSPPGILALAPLEAQQARAAADARAAAESTVTAAARPLRASLALPEDLPMVDAGGEGVAEAPAERRVRGQGAFKALMEAQGSSTGTQLPAIAAAAAVGAQSTPTTSAAAAATEPAAGAAPSRVDSLASRSDGEDGVAGRADSERDFAATVNWRLSRVDSSASGSVSHPGQLRGVLQDLAFDRGKGGITREELGEGLARLGYQVESSELGAMVEQLDLDRDGVIKKPEFVASQIDWSALETDYRDVWLQCAKRAFSQLDANGDGKLTSGELLRLLQDKLPAQELEYALEDALIEEGFANADDIDFNGFLRMVKAPSTDSLEGLEQYESRLAAELTHPAFHPALETLAEKGDEEMDESGK